MTSINLGTIPARKMEFVWSLSNPRKYEPTIFFDRNAANFMRKENMFIKNMQYTSPEHRMKLKIE